MSYLCELSIGERQMDDCQITKGFGLQSVIERQVEIMKRVDR